jgi:hypothetical protein
MKSFLVQKSVVNVVKTGCIEQTWDSIFIDLRKINMLSFNKS